jgi:L-ascorbate metabolism protein UlaG (beta-lactamase superfamily)
MKLKWFGQSCFLLTSGDGVRIVMDPFNSRIGYRMPELSADIVTTSHGHSDHNFVEAVSGKFVRLDKPGKYSIDGIDIVGVLTNHDRWGGHMRGKNVVFNFSVDGLKVCHCGDLGHALTAIQVEAIGKVDVLLTPVGGLLTLNAKDAKLLADVLRPTVIIPMHYKTDKLRLPIGGVDKFIDVMGSCKKPGTQEIEISKDNIEQYAGAVVLNYE